MANTTTTKFIEVMKDQHDKNSKRYFNIAMIFLGILIIDVILIIAANRTYVSGIEMLTIYCLFMSIVIFGFMSHGEKQWIKSINEWYQSKTGTLENNEGPEQSE